MTKYFSFLWILLLTVACKQNSDKAEQTDEIKKNTTIRLYSKSVADSFSIFVSLPNDYNPQGKETYPVVYLLDANLYFDIIATTVDKYSEVGLAPSVILVGIGYKDLPTMDSLRKRDDTYPIAIPEYEMSVSGGADKFLAFINNDLIPHIDKEYKSNTSKRILMGHSLGGYFTVYALLQDLLGKNDSLNSYISASPSIHYNKYYLLSQLKETPLRKNRVKKIKAYVTYGGLEDDENSSDSSMIKTTELSAQLSSLLSEKPLGYVIFKSDIYSNLGHMDTQLPTFIKGLQWALSEEK